MTSVGEKYKGLLKEENNTQLLNELKYLKSLMIVRKIYLSGKISYEILDKLNRKNAETCGCFPMDFR